MLTFEESEKSEKTCTNMYYVNRTSIVGIVAFDDNETPLWEINLPCRGYLLYAGDTM